MPRICFSPNCRTGYEKNKNGEKTPSLFRAPKNPEVFELWRRSIPRADRELTPNDNICANHFKKEDILDFYETKLKDGTLWQMVKGKTTLKKGAIPCIFSNIPGHSTYKSESKVINKKTSYKRKNHAVVGNRKKVKRLSDKPIIAETVASENSHSSNENDIGPIDFAVELNTFCSKDIEHVQNERCLSQPLLKPVMKPLKHFPFAINSDLLNKNSTDQLETAHSSDSFTTIEENKSIGMFNSELLNEEQFSFNFLRNNINKIEKINSWWTTIVFEDFIICARWNSDFALERKIVILKDLKVKVFLKEKETFFESDIQVESIKAILELMHRVEEIKICNGIHIEETNCQGYVQTKLTRTNLCVNCLKYKIKKKLLQPLEISKDQVELIRFNMN